MGCLVSPNRSHLQNCLYLNKLRIHLGQTACILNIFVPNFQRQLLQMCEAAQDSKASNRFTREPRKGVRCPQG